MSSQRRSRTTVTSVVRSSARPSVITTTTRSRLPTNITTRNRTRRTRARGFRDMTASEVVADYIATLSDPFCYGPLRLGWGTMIPTGLGTAFYRAPVAAASDGTFAFFVMPYLRNTTGQYGVFYNTAGLTTATWTPQGWANQAAYANLASQVRCVSIGLKVYPQVPLTSAPGVIYSGSIPEATIGGLTTNTIQFLAGSPYLETGYGNVGAMATGRPIDPLSYAFQAFLADGASVSNSSPISVPIILGTGFPANTNVIVEAVLNFEYELSTSWNDQVLPGPMEGGAELDESLSSSFPNIETMWAAIRRRLPPVSLTDSISNLARNSGLAAIRAVGRTMLASASTGSTGRSRTHTALLNGAAAAAGALASGTLDTVRQTMFGSASTGRRDRALIEEYAVV
jgi:hypothetical protein